MVRFHIQGHIYPVLGKLLLESNKLQLLITHAFNGQFTKTTRYQNVQSLWMLPVMLRPDGQTSLKAKILALASSI